MSPMRVGTLDTRRRRRPGIPRGRGRVVFAAVTVLALLYVIGLASGDDERVANAVRDAVETTGTVAPTATIASPTEVNASITATLLPAALSRAAVTVDGSTIALFGGRNTKGASLTQVLRYEPSTGLFTALAIYDMCKSMDRGMVISDLALWEKMGGKSGTYRRDPAS